MSFQFKDGMALYLDMYELTMANSFYLHQQDDLVSFEVFVRNLPTNRGYLVAAGLEQAVSYLENVKFDESDIKFLEEQGCYSPGFLKFLSTWRFRGSVEAIAEGTVFGPGCPVMRISANRIDATLVESALLAIINHQTMVASKAARIADAAQGKPVWDFSLRRLHGPQAALGVARAAFIGGCAGSATVIAGKELGLAITGTMAHHFVQAWEQDKEQEAFEQFLLDYPTKSTILVDTYDALEGVRRAIAASRKTGVALGGVRLDSGDLLELSQETRRILDAAGMPNTKIIASNDLDEYKIEELLKHGTPIDSFGVGTMLGTSADAPSLGGVYKLVCQEMNGHMRPVIKLASQKVTNPGMHQVFRQKDRDVIALMDENLGGQKLLNPIMKNGKRIVELPSLEQIRSYAKTQIAALSPEVRSINNPKVMTITISKKLLELKTALGFKKVEVVTITQDKKVKKSTNNEELVA